MTKENNNHCSRYDESRRNVQNLAKIDGISKTLHVFCLTVSTKRNILSVVWLLLIAFIL